MEQILFCRELSKSYGGSVYALRNLNLILPKGKIIGLLGPNGSGKTTLIKMIAGILTPTSGALIVDGNPVGPYTKSVVSYLPERTYLEMSMKVRDCLTYFQDFYADFDRARAEKMLSELGVNPDARMNTLSKGTKEKVQLILVMSRNAKLYLLDEPIAGVDPAAREYILNTVIKNYNPDSTILISTHLITDIESVLDEFVFIKQGELLMYNSVKNAREQYQKSIDELFREVFRCYPN